MRYERVIGLSNERFYRLTGVRRETFEEMVTILHDQRAADEATHKHRGGRRHKLSIADKLLMTLEYWREYRTHFHISESYEVSETSAWRTIRWVEDALIHSGKFTLPGKKSCRSEELDMALLMMDATETPIERPKKRA